MNYKNENDKDGNDKHRNDKNENGKDGNDKNENDKNENDKDENDMDIDDKDLINEPENDNIEEFLDDCVDLEKKKTSLQISSSHETSDSLTNNELSQDDEKMRPSGSQKGTIIKKNKVPAEYLWMMKYKADNCDDKTVR